MESGKALRVICILLVGLLFIQHEVSAEFTLSSTATDATAKVTEKTVVFDVVPGSLKDNSKFEFYFVAGECTSNLTLTYYPQGYSVVKVNNPLTPGENTVPDLNKVEVTDAGVKFFGLSGDKSEVECRPGPMFDPMGKNFKIDFKLTGNVSTVLSMTSKAERYLASDDNKDGDVLPWWVLYIIFPLIGFFIFLFIAISVFVGVILCRRTKARKAAATKAEVLAAGENPTESAPASKPNSEVVDNNDKKKSVKETDAKKPKKGKKESVKEADSQRTKKTKDADDKSARAQKSKTVVTDRSYAANDPSDFRKASVSVVHEVV